MRKIILTIIGILLVILIYIFIDANLFMSINVKNNIAEINTFYNVNDFVGNVINAKIIDYDKEIIFDKLGSNKLEITLQNKFSKIYTKEIEINVVDKTNPVIECNNIDSYVYDNIDLLKNVKVTDNSKEDIIPTIEGSYDINKVGVYDLKYVAKDSSGNSSECSFKLNIKDKMAIADISKNQYYVKLNKTQNVLMVYSLDTSGNYNILVKTFVISAGNDTPIGVFKLKDKHDYISFAGGSYGRYGSRINDSYWFHSVPYNSLPNNGLWNNVSYNEYNKLGTLASHGCIRLSVKDAKWIFDNIPSGTIIDIYESNTLPKGVVKPEPIKIDINSKNRGWDPTDSSEYNPWNN